MSSNRSELCGNMDFDAADRVAQIFGYVQVYISTWIHFILGTPGHLILLLAFYKQIKEETAYMYQVFVTVNQTFQLLFWALLILCLKHLSGGDQSAGVDFASGALWYKKSYFLMYFAGSVCWVFYSCFYTLSLLLSVAMSADRFYAVAFPVKYRSLTRADKMRQQWTALLCCLFIGVPTSWPDWGLFNVVETGDHYELQLNMACLESQIRNCIRLMRNVVRVVGLVALITLNVALVRLYRSHLAKVAPEIRAGADQKKRKRVNQEKTLLLLTTCQSTFQAFAVLTSVSFQLGMYTSTYFFNCLRNQVYGLVDLNGEICDILDLYVTMGINKQFRNHVLRSLPCYKPKAVQVSSVNRNPGRRVVN